jgi:hypothetical protein
MCTLDTLPYLSSCQHIDKKESPVHQCLELQLVAKLLVIADIKGQSMVSMVFDFDMAIISMPFTVPCTQVLGTVSSESVSWRKQCLRFVKQEIMTHKALVFFPVCSEFIALQAHYMLSSLIPEEKLHFCTLSDYWIFSTLPLSRCRVPIYSLYLRDCIMITCTTIQRGAGMCCPLHWLHTSATHYVSSQTPSLSFAVFHSLSFAAMPTKCFTIVGLSEQISWNLWWIISWVSVEQCVDFNSMLLKILMVFWSSENKCNCRVPWVHSSK